ncbi:MAG: divalent metal cation transporter, partial [Rudaea sp.]
MPEAKAENVEQEVRSGSPPQKLVALLKSLGPGLITGASDDDPATIGTMAQTGALFGLTQLWTMLFTIPLMIGVQEMCARIGLQTGEGLAGVIRKHYPKPLLYFAVILLVVVNTINLGADLGAMAASAKLVIPLPFIVLLILMTGVSAGLEIF